MKRSVLAIAALLCCGACVIDKTPRWYQTEPSSAQKSDLVWGVDVLVLDPLTTAASEVDDLHGARKHAVCRVGPERAGDLLQLCRDKGFDGVTFTFEKVTEKLTRRAAELDLPVLIDPAGTAGRRTTTGS